MLKNEQLNKQIFIATKWASIAEIVAKIIIPVTNIILARLLVPEAFGIIATVTMIISFVEMFSDSGFQKYLIQHEFKSNKDLYESANVAFWTNLFLSVFLWVIILVFNSSIAQAVGSPELGNVVAIACIQLPLSAVTSIQIALYRRFFDFKKLFFARLASICVPIVVTIPLALLGFEHWSLVIGSICMQLINSIILTIQSNWKPRFQYSMSLLKKMFSFSVWSSFEAMSIWMTAWIDTFIVGYFLSQYYLGLYKTSTSIVNSLLGLITAAIVPILFSTLSRLQNDDLAFKEMFFKFQRLVAILVFPIGVGVYLYSDLATLLLLGSQWGEASRVIGLWALTSAIVIVFGHFCSEVYRAKGQPKLSLIAQLIHLSALVPTCFIASPHGFWILVLARSLIRIQSIIVHLIIMSKFFKITMLKTIKNVIPPIVASILMYFFGTLLKILTPSLIFSFISIFSCIFLYFVILLLFPKIRYEMKALVLLIIPRIIKK
jgi:PST family polysaccharide transporter